MYRYIILGAVVFLILFIFVVVFLKIMKKNKKNAAQLPKLTNKQYMDMRSRRNGVGVNRNLEPNLVNGSFAGKNVDLDATQAMDNISGEKAFLVDRVHNKQLLVTKQSIVIGTDVNKADFIIRESNVVSRQHALLYKKDGCYFVTDNHSTNHTYVNEIILKPGEMRELSAGDIIRCADVSLEFIVR